MNAVLFTVLLIVGMLVQVGGFPRTVTDLTGVAVTIPVPPSVIALIGEDPILVRLAAADLRRIDPAAGMVDWSGIGLLVVPDLYAAAYPALVESAQAARVPVFRTIPITSLDGWRQAVTQIGLAVGREDRAVRLIRCLDWQLALVERGMRDVSPARVVVLTPEGYTFGRDTLITNLIAVAGGINAAAEAGFDDYRQIDDPTLHALAPDVVLLTPAWSRADSAALAGSLPGVRVHHLRFSPAQPRDPGWAVLWLSLVLRL